MRTLLMGILIAAAAPTTAAAQQGDILDMTYAFDDKTIYWPTAKPFRLEVVHKGSTKGGWHYEANNYSAAEHGGTHLDAPNQPAGGLGGGEPPSSNLRRAAGLPMRCR